MPMQSTGGEKFTVYVYYRTKPVTQEDLDYESSSSEDDEESEAEVFKTPIKQVESIKGKEAK